MMQSSFDKTLKQLRTNDPSLTNLLLWGDDLDATGLQTFTEVLKINNTLTCLDLAFNKIGPAGAQLIAEVLKTNTSLTELHITRNEIGSAGAIIFADILKINTSLVSLYLGGNQIDAVGAQLLAQALDSNLNLQKLNLGNNQIDLLGIQALAQVLKTNNTLMEINLSGNKIDTEGVRIIAESLKTNTGLTQILLRDIPIDSAGIQFLREALKHNYTLLNLALDQDDNLIRTYFHRNERIALYLKPLTKSLTSEERLTNDKDIEGCLEDLQTLLPELQQLPKNSYPQEAYRLLTYLNQASLAMDESPSERLYHLLSLTPFQHRPFQNEIDQQILGLLLSNELIKPLQARNVIREKQLLTLGLLQVSLDEPELRPFASLALFKLLHPGQEYTIEAREHFDTQTCLLSENELRQLVGSALTASNEQGKNSESYLLTQVLNAPRGNINLLVAACGSPAFLKALKARYPKAQEVTTIAHCLKTAKNQSPLTLAIPQAPQWLPDAINLLQAGLLIEVLTYELKESLAFALRPTPELVESDEEDNVEAEEQDLPYSSSSHEQIISSSFTFFSTESSAEASTNSQDETKTNKTPQTNPLTK